jgi:CRP-like cAMP-binding protein
MMDDNEHTRAGPGSSESSGNSGAPPAQAGAGDSVPAGGPGSAAAARAEGFAAAHAAEQNRLLAALPLEEYALLLPRLTPVRLRLKDVLVEPGVPMRDVWFVREGVASVIATEQAGGDIEVGTIGPEGFVGLPVLNGTDRMPYRVFVQVPGEGWRLPAEEFRRLVDERPVVRKLLLRFSQYFTDQVSQHAACNQLHTVEERCSRWLLMTHDRVQGDAFEITHEFLALMLGVRRAGVTVAMGTLQAGGIVRCTRGRVSILDRPRLEEASCGCYHVTRAELARLLG